MPLNSLGAGPDDAFHPERDGNKRGYVPTEELSADDSRLHPLAPQANTANERAEEEEPVTIEERLQIFHDALAKSEEQQRREFAEYVPSLEVRQAQERIEKALQSENEVTDAELLEAGFDKQHATELVKSLRQWARTEEDRWNDSHGKRGRQ